MSNQDQIQTLISSGEQKLPLDINSIYQGLLQPDINIEINELLEPLDDTITFWSIDQCINYFVYYGIFGGDFWSNISLDEDSTFKDDRQKIKKDFTRKIDRYYNAEEIVNFVNDVENLSAKDEIDDCLDYVYETFDEKLIGGNYDFCNSILQSLLIPKINASILIGFLTITLPWGGFLSSRSSFFIRVKKDFLQRFTGLKVERMLFGLE